MPKKLKTNQDRPVTIRAWCQTMLHFWTFAKASKEPQIVVMPSDLRNITALSYSPSPKARKKGMHMAAAIKRTSAPR